MASATTRESSLSLPPYPFCQRELVHNLKVLLRMDQWNVRENPSDSVDGDGSHCHRDAPGFSVSSPVVLWDSFEYYILHSLEPQEGIWNFNFLQLPGFYDVRSGRTRALFSNNHPPRCWSTDAKQARSEATGRKKIFRSVCHKKED